MKKIVRAFFVALVIMIATASVVLANGVKGFEPYKVPVDKNTLPEEVSEADLDGEHISAHRLEEIAKEKGDDVVIEGTDGNTYTAKHNMLGHVPTSSLVAVNKEEGKAEGEKEPDEKPEEPSKEDSNTPPETGMSTAPDPGESKNEEPSPAPHTHSYEWWYEEVNGLTHTNYYKCSCGDYYSESWNETTKEDKRDDGGSTNNSNPGGQDAGKKESESDAPSPKNDLPKNDPPAHEHAWEEVRTVIHHDAVTEKVWVVDKAAWDEQVLVKEAWDEVETVLEYEEEEYVIGGGGLEFPSVEAFSAWLDSLSDEEYEATSTEYSIRWREVPIYVDKVVHHDAEYKTVHHDEEGHYEEKVVTPAYDEEKVTGYKCSCGATKKP